MPDNIFIILAVSLALTLVIELGFALIMRIKELRLIALINVVTNPPAVLLAYACGYSLPIVLMIEVLVVIIEGTLYSRYSDMIKRPFLYSIIVNLISYLIGVVL